MALSESTFDDIDLFDEFAAESELAGRLPHTWEVTTYDADPDVETIDVTLTRADDATVNVDWFITAPDGEDADDREVVHTVTASPQQARDETVVAREDRQGPAVALASALRYALEHREEAMCDREELRRRLFLYLGVRYGDTVEAKQRQWARIKNEIGPVEALEERAALPISDTRDFREAVHKLAENVHQGWQVQSFSNLEVLYDDDDRVVALRDFYGGDVIRRAPDATVEDFQETALEPEAAFREAVLAEVCERFGDHFEEELERMDGGKHAVMREVGEELDSAGVESVAVAVGERVFERLAGGE